LSRLPAAGAARPTLLLESTYGAAVADFNGPMAVAADHDAVCWTNIGALGPDGGPDWGGSLVKMALDGGNTSHLAEGPASSIAMDADNVYWVEGPVSVDSILRTGTLMRVSKAGGVAVTLCSGVVGSGIALDDDSAYVALLEDKDAGGQIVIAKISKAGGPVTVLAAAGNPNGIATNGSTVFWSEWSDQAIDAVSTFGGAAAVLAKTRGAPGPVAADAMNVYWTTTLGVQSVAVTGGAVRTLSDQQAGALALDDAGVYWLAFSPPPPCPPASYEPASNETINSVSVAR
jgi:hypothetical protein